MGNVSDILFKNKNPVSSSFDDLYQMIANAKVEALNLKFLEENENKPDLFNVDMISNESLKRKYHSILKEREIFMKKNSAEIANIYKCLGQISRTDSKMIAHLKSKPNSEETNEFLNKLTCSY